MYVCTYVCMYACIFVRTSERKRCRNKIILSSRTFPTRIPDVYNVRPLHIYMRLYVYKYVDNVYVYMYNNINYL